MDSPFLVAHHLATSHVRITRVSRVVYQPRCELLAQSHLRWKRWSRAEEHVAMK